MIHRAEVALAGLLIAAGVASLLLYTQVFVDPVDPEDWARASAWVVENARDGDIVRIEPNWFERGLVPLGPVGDRVQRIRAPIVEDMHGVEQVLIVSDSARVEEAKDALPWITSFEAHPFGSATVLRAQAPDDHIVWELRNSLHSVEVTRVQGDEVERCTRWNPAKKRWDCRKTDQWQYVGEAEREMGDEPRKCVWAHPLDRGRTLRLDVVVPTADTIRVRDSFDLRAARLGGDPVLMQVFVNEELQVEDRVAGNDDDWQAHDIDVRGIDGPMNLRIEVDLLGSIKRRFFCLNAWAFRHPQ